jgi:heme/copper-type cytochrome/quinol oxidase subunit 3
MENYTKKIEPEKTRTSKTSKMVGIIFLLLFLAFAIFFATFMFASASQENDLVSEMIADKGAPLVK